MPKSRRERTSREIFGRVPVRTISSWKNIRRNSMMYPRKNSWWYARKTFEGVPEKNLELLEKNLGRILVRISEGESWWISEANFGWISRGCLEWLSYGIPIAVGIPEKIPAETFKWQWNKTSGLIREGTLEEIPGVRNFCFQIILIEFQKRPKQNGIK